LIAAGVALGSAIARFTENTAFILPALVWTLFVGAVIRNGLAMANLHAIDGEPLQFAGAVALSLFLAMALMSLELWELAAPALPIFLILCIAGDRRGAVHDIHLPFAPWLEFRSCGVGGRAMRVRTSSQPRPMATLLQWLLPGSQSGRRRSTPRF